MILVSSFSAAGGHPVNEDAFVVEPHPADSGCWLCCLGDGQGGRPGGARAAQLACQTALAAARKELPRRLASPSTWPTLLRQADRAVRDDREAGLTTLIGFCIVGGYLCGASCGDSAVLVATAGTEAGEVTAGQRKNPPVGSGSADFRPFSAALTTPWMVLAMSDGVWKYAGWDGIYESVRAAGGQQLIEQLQRLAKPRGGSTYPDDFTVIVFEKPA